MRTYVPSWPKVQPEAPKKLYWITEPPDMAKDQSNPVTHKLNLCSSADGARVWIDGPGTYHIPPSKRSATGSCCSKAVENLRLSWGEESKVKSEPIH